MRKIQMCLTAIVAFLGSVSSVSYAGQSPVNELPPDPLTDMTSDEEVFSGQLNDQNQQQFAQMTSAQRREVMSMVGLFNDTGDGLSPDAALDKVVSTLQEKE